MTNALSVRRFIVDELRVTAPPLGLGAYGWRRRPPRDLLASVPLAHGPCLP